MDETDWEQEFVEAAANDPIVHMAEACYRNDVFESEADALKACVVCLVRANKRMLELLNKLEFSTVRIVAVPPTSGA